MENKVSFQAGSGRISMGLRCPHGKPGINRQVWGLFAPPPMLPPKRVRDMPGFLLPTAATSQGNKQQEMAGLNKKAPPVGGAFLLNLLWFRSGQPAVLLHPEFSPGQEEASYTQ